MFRLRRTRRISSDTLSASKLFDQDTFYQAFLCDLKNARSQIIIESPFITVKRMNVLMPAFQQLAERGVHITINTKLLDEHEPTYYLQAEEVTDRLQALGILVLLTNGHHRKLAIVDRQITWEGSLNILSQNDSCEVMRRIYSEQLSNQTLDFLHLENFIG
jgi:phosphatidylserine/phosphatidylglycerophosphate/cardiolipin synthase-like enzyme